MSNSDRGRKLAELRARQRAERRRPIIIAAAVVLVVIVAAAVGITLWVGSGSSSAPPSTAPAAGQIIPSTPTGKTTVQQPAKRVPNTTGIKGVLSWDTDGWPGNGKPHPGALQHDHVTGPVTYRQTPPVGGPHNPIWMNAGVYTKPVPNARAVHNLEHGAIWITYRPNLPASQVKQLVAFVGKQSLIDESAATGISGQENRYMDLSPWPGDSLPAPIVLSAWGHQLYVTSPTDPRMQQFVDTFRHSPKYTPEYGAAVDGVPVQTGGRAAEYGATKPNPPGTAQTPKM